MINDFVKNLVSIKQTFSKNYSGGAHIQEIIPSLDTTFPIEKNHLILLHNFAQKNPIYYNSFEETIENILCTIYEGDINEYWLDSIKHGSSCQPFYPTWIMSAYAMAFIAKELGFKELIDIGSGDGRIAFCGKILGLISHSIEIDDKLVELQNEIIEKIHQNFNPKCQDALDVDYAHLKLKHPVFFIGGLSQMGGDILATSIIEKINSISVLKNNAGIVFAGSHSKRKLSGDISNGGWNALIKKYDLKILHTVSLPTVWTFDQKIETPYIYTKFNQC